MRSRSLVTVTLSAVLAGGALAASDAAVPHRSVLRSQAPDGRPLEGDAADVTLAGSGQTLAFTTTGTTFLSTGDPNGPVADVVALDGSAGRRRRVSEGFGGAAPDGPSVAPALSTSGRVVAFVSAATNLVTDDSNGLPDVFVRDGDNSAARVSVAADGGPADGGSWQPDISGDGRFVAFTSSAANLVAGDTNGQPDVFVRDLAAGTTRRVSVSTDGRQGTAPASAPALSADGTAVAFVTASSGLVAGDTNGVGDVFVRELARDRTERVSVATGGRQQDRAVAFPFAMAPDISGDGRYVVFDTDATTLYRRDTNRRTDVYLHDRAAGTTRLVSVNSVNVQGNNDSVTPRITPNGRFVSFQSFASNLTADDGPGPDLFLFDRRSATTTLVNATDAGTRRPQEPVRQLLQRAPVTDDGRTAAFLSGARIVAGGPSGQGVQLYTRTLTAPRLKLVGVSRSAAGMVTAVVAADDRSATRFLCRLDGGRAYRCGARIMLEAGAGRVLTVRAGGPGMLWSAARRIVLTRP